ncbi:uncharacterized protein PRCAT00002008001 [Priceomyces carsonii]|uniref:uncharacterized protein n=1 Tax=Priceomyces carsonii TaxID=28549 RepID=UPI002EDB7FE2|nr:unnamed protein product [Priceomyces carsonii]
MDIKNNNVPVVVSLDQIRNGVDFETLDKAFGSDSLGILLVNGLPDEYKRLRLDVLKSASVLGNLLAKELSCLELKESSWLIGWSCGKEILSKSKEPDFNKGSYYINCAFHTNPDLEGPPQDVCDKYTEFKSYTSPNIWPSKETNGLELFESNCKKLCNMIIDIAEIVAKNCDNYIQKSNIDCEKGFLERVVKNSTTTKARLLHYYPVNKGSNTNDSWCGEHLDHSCLTGLTSALFIDESQGLTSKLSSSPDPEAGLYIKNRASEIVKVNIPNDCLAFQSGSALEEISKSSFKAVPHYVKGTSMANIARNTLAVFCQPNLDELVNENQDFAQYAHSIIRGNH